MNRLLSVAFLSLVTIVLHCQEQQRPRVRDIGLKVGILATGVHNAITDVPGVRVGHVTLASGDKIRTGVTAIIPHGGNIFRSKIPAAIVVGNGFGKLVGFTQVEELGELETPIVLTNTLSVWTAADAIVEFVLNVPGNESVRSINPVVGETNDGTLNDIRGRHVTRDAVLQALERAEGGAVEEGSVGAGTGTICFGWKGGVGTSSRILTTQMSTYTIGVLVQTNFGGTLQIDGVPIGKELGRFGLKGQVNDGSCMIVVATDAPLDARALKRLARRALAGLARTGSAMTHGSGDYVIAFSTAEQVRIPLDSPRLRKQDVLPQKELSPLFQGVIEATEEAIYNSLLKATTMTGNGRTVEALPIEKVKEILRKYQRIE